MDPNNYFLIVLGGFSVVWSFRYFAKRRDVKISEFEYAAFSALWGIPVFVLFIFVTKSLQGYLDNLFVLPMLYTPILVLIGAGLGFVGSEVFALWRHLRGK